MLGFLSSLSLALLSAGVAKSAARQRVQAAIDCCRARSDDSAALERARQRFDSARACEIAWHSACAALCVAASYFAAIALLTDSTIVPCGDCRALALSLSPDGLLALALVGPQSLVAAQRAYFAHCARDPKDARAQSAGFDEMTEGLIARAILVANALSKHDSRKD